MGGGPGRHGRAGGSAPAPRDLWQLSAAPFPDRSSALEFIWVTVTGGVCCDKRLMGTALGSCLDTCGVGGRGAGLLSLPLPHARPWLGHPVQGRCGAFFCHGSLSPAPFIPGLQPSVSTLLLCRQPGAQEH